MLAFTHSEVGTGQKVIKLKLKIGTGSITGVRSRLQPARFVIAYGGFEECVLPSIRYFRYYYHVSVSPPQSSCL